MRPSFDLVQEPWLPCVDGAGRVVEVGLRRALVEAHSFRFLRGESPLMTAALLRLLLAVLHSALDGPEDWKDWRTLWKAGRWPERKVSSYLDQWHDRFDLFHPKYPFMQVGGLEIEDGKTTPVSKLALEWATGSNATLFDHGFEERPRSLKPASAARQLVTAQAFALSGGQSASSKTYGKHPYFANTPLVGGTAVFLEGSTLFETLALNLLTRDYVRTSERDAPTWERSKLPNPGERKPAGHLEFLTWLARYVRLVPNESGVVSEMHFAQGWSVDGDYPNPLWGYVQVQDKGFLPIDSQLDRALWRDSGALLAAGRNRMVERNRPAAVKQAVDLIRRKVLEPERLFCCLAIGLCRQKKRTALPLLWREDRVSLPSVLLEDDVAGDCLAHGVQTAEKVATALKSSIYKFRTSLQVKAATVPALEVQQRAAFEYWSGLDAQFHRFVADLGTRGELALDPWIATLVASAREAYARATDNAARRGGIEHEARAAGYSKLNRMLKTLGAIEEGDTDATH